MFLRSGCLAGSVRCLASRRSGQPGLQAHVAGHTRALTQQLPALESSDSPENLSIFKNNAPRVDCAEGTGARATAEQQVRVTGGFAGDPRAWETFRLSIFELLGLHTLQHCEMQEPQAPEQSLSDKCASLVMLGDPRASDTAESVFWDTLELDSSRTNVSTDECRSRKRQSSPSATSARRWSCWATRTPGTPSRRSCLPGGWRRRFRRSRLRCACRCALPEDLGNSVLRQVVQACGGAVCQTAGHLAAEDTDRGAPAGAHCLEASCCSNPSDSGQPDSAAADDSCEEFDSCLLDGGPMLSPTQWRCDRGTADAAREEARNRSRWGPAAFYGGELLVARNAIFHFPPPLTTCRISANRRRRWWRPR